MIASVRIGLLIVCTTLIACSESPAPSPAPSDPTPGAPADPQTPEQPDSESSAQNPTEDPAADPEALANRGRAVYTANCIACHNPDASLDGGIGPAVAGSSLELLEARIMRNEYPEDYRPKRDTRAMIPLPYLEKDLKALATYLAR